MGVKSDKVEAWVIVCKKYGLTHIVYGFSRGLIVMYRNQCTDLKATLMV
jgi:hypothetical protein